MKLMTLTMLLLPVMALLPAAAEPAAEAGLASQQITVRELMRLDDELALEAARRRRGQAAKAEPAAAAARQVRAGGAGAGPLRLVGIYGVGRQLFAEVRSGSGRLLFLRGHPLPLGHEGSTQSYRLKALAGSCVRLVHDTQETELCLSRRGGE